MAFGIQTTVTANTLEEGMRRGVVRLTRATEEGVEDEARLAQRRIRYHTPRKEGTHRRSVKWELVKRGKKIGFRVFSDLPTFVIIERGSKKHRIVAKVAKALRFFAGGRIIFRRSVEHPGTPAFRPFRKGTAVYRSGRAPLIRKRLTEEMQRG